MNLFELIFLTEPEEEEPYEETNYVEEKEEEYLGQVNPSVLQ